MRLHIPHNKYYLFCLFWILILGLGATQSVQATHIRAGEILARPDSVTNNPLRIFFKLITYTDVAKTSADNPRARLFFGDGTTSQEVDRTPANGVIIRADTRRSVYYFEHTYPAPGTYSATYAELNRAIGVVNIANSESQSFLLRTTVTIDPFIGVNSSPELQVPPLDFADCDQIFVHNPGAFDRDGDQLKFKLRVPLKNIGTPEKPTAANVSGFRVLNDPSLSAGCPDNPNILTMDENTGQLTWNTPCMQGDYNVAFVIEEYRNGRKIGEVIRDMQIRVRCSVNRRPILKIPNDTCVVAGSVLNGFISATDPDNDPFILEAFAREIMPPATFVQNGKNGLFSWATTCADVQAQPYQVIFKVTDIPVQGVPYVDVRPWRITVVGPAPQNLKVTPVGRNVVLNWNLYGCQNATNIQIYRHEGVSDFVPGKCQTGIPASAGFVKVGEVSANTTTFTDNGGTAGLKRGVTYCYVIYATFPSPNGGESIATLPVCTLLETNVPLLTNVDVVKTDVGTGGIINVKWTKPVDGLQNLVQPLQYRLFRAPGATPTNFTEIFRTNDLNVTSFTDTGISTSAAAGDVKYIYKIEFYQNGGASASDLVDNSPTATSVQLKAVSRATSIALNWTYNVPWDNSRRKHYIYRKINNAFELIDSTSAVTRTAGQYVDRGTYKNMQLVPNQPYCYYVETRGIYGNPKLNIIEPLKNRSQEFCTTLKDSVAPCPPVLSIDQLDCEAFLQEPTTAPYQNVLTWVPDVSANCDQDIAYYTIYYRAGDEGEFDSIAFTNPGVTTYTHRNLPSYAGCYVVTATDEAGNKSKQSNIVCKDICFFFILPNIITPNGDGINDTFVPDRRSQFIKSVKFTVYSRWGDKVYESDQDPGINWKGVNSAGKPLSAGTYYYMAEVEFFTLSPNDAKKTYKGWVEIVR